MFFVIWPPLAQVKLFLAYIFSLHFSPSLLSPYVRLALARPTLAEREVSQLFQIAVLQMSSEAPRGS